MSLAYIPGTMAAISGARPEESGLAPGIVNTSYQIGSALGLAVITVIASAATQSALSVQPSETFALTEGFNTAFISAAALSGAGLLIALFSIKKGD